jgi:HEAT repeat protein
LHPDKNVRIEAALEIGKLADPAALPALLERLGAEPDFFVRENVTWAVVRMGDAAVLPVVALLQEGDVASRFNAAHTLSKLADARAVPALLTTLDDPDPALVQKAAYALGRIRDVRALPALVSRVGVGPRELRASVSEAVEAFGDAAVPELLAAFHGNAVEVRVDSAEILGAIGGVAAVDALVSALADDAWEVRFAAVNALRESLTPTSVAGLERAVSDLHASVRMLAGRILTDMRDV